MGLARSRIVQIALVLLLQGLVLLALQALLPGLRISSYWSAIGAAVAYSVAQAAWWYVFIQFLSWLPQILYPIFTFVLSGLSVYLFANLVPGLRIDSWITGLWITIWMTVGNSILGALFSLDEDTAFDRRITQRMAKKVGQAAHTDVPGFLFVEIDGLGEGVLRRALAQGHMPNLKRWLDRGSHQITGWETEFTSQTGAMQPGILLGNNDDIPAYRWWDRLNKRIVLSGSPRDAEAVEKQRSRGRGLLTDGGASRGNMFSGDATESMITMSTTLDRSRKHGPGFYSYLLNPYVVARLLSRFVMEILKEWWQAWQQRWRGDPYRITARNPAYALMRGFMSPIMQDLVSFMVISDVLRGLPAIYALYAGYDDLAHFAGMTAPEAMEALRETDRYIGRIEKALPQAPRPYHVIVLSDHGQTLGFTFEHAHGVKLEDLVDALIEGKGDVYVAQKTHETWDKLSALLTESTQGETRTAGFMRSMLRSRQRGGQVDVGPRAEDEKARAKQVVVVASGCSGLIYFTEARRRMSSEEINRAHPDLLLGLTKHPGIGFVLVKSETLGNMVIGKNGVRYLDDGKVEGQDPLADYSPNAVQYLRRQAGFSNCPDLLVNTAYDPKTQEMCGFENQVSHHGGLGGPQNKAFLLHPVELSAGTEPITMSERLHDVLRGWRTQVQGLA